MAELTIAQFDSIKRMLWSKNEDDVLLALQIIHSRTKDLTKNQINTVGRILKRQWNVMAKGYNRTTNARISHDWHGYSFSNRRIFELVNQYAKYDK